ncbi:MAG: 3-oxoacyl-ACP synthase III family protein [Syntrophobacteraceae bacterium]
MKIRAAISAIEYHLPRTVLSNDQLASEFPEWSVEKIAKKTGISIRYVSDEDECASDLGVAAARRLFDKGVCQPSDIDFLLFCTQSPDYFLPSTACIMQERLGIPTRSGALDFNLGCSGFVYGLGLAKGLIETGQAQNVLLVTAETYSKYLHPSDKSVRTLFGDAGAATLIQSTSGQERELGYLSGPFVYGTDGQGAKNLIVPFGGMRCPEHPDKEQAGRKQSKIMPSVGSLYMNGPEIFTFTLNAVPKAIRELLVCSGKTLDDIGLFVFHQANKYILDRLRKKIEIPENKFYLSLCYGNTVSATIPIALKHAWEDGKLQSGQLVVLAGFGVGYSWGATLIEWV